ncbi:M28 family peptidase [Phenylobacterium montanum]|uniref:Carboxypeptidase Q n=1 Tax=Phenylobacterium montanum TaxID=2823693 RepID=A0A975FYD1_9CAUL|nr:M28 family peptidase [Caulobacter sp. S6]QUD87469.1 M28 family peptidase [Caulobacter sp. S6]
MRSTVSALALAVSLVAGAVQAQSIPETAAALRDKALAGSPAYDILESLTTEVGPRPTGSPAQKRAMEWGVAKLKALGFSNVHVEPFSKQAWTRGPESAEITGPYPQKLAILGLGGTIPTPPDGIEAPIALFHTYADMLAAPTGSLSGKIAVVTEPMVRTENGAGYGAVILMRVIGPQEAARRGAVAYLIRSLSTADDRFPHTGNMEPASIPAAALSPVDAALIDRMAARGQPVTIRLKLDSHITQNAQAWNVVGEIKGREHPEQVVVIGGHLDSWDPGTGAIDDGAGVAITTATGKLIADLPRAPRRTVRVVMFGSEETDGSGAAYAAAHKGEVANIVLGGESDLGSDRIYKLRLAPGGVADPALKGLADLLAPLKIIVDKAPADDAGADIEGLQALGAPIMTYYQDASRYFDTHHSANDVIERVDRKSLDQNVAAWAALIYTVAESDVDFRKGGK